MKAVAAAIALAVLMSPLAARAVAFAADEEHASPARIFAGKALEVLDAAAPGSFLAGGGRPAGPGALRAVARPPEPDAYTIVLAGLGLIAYMARRRKNALYAA